MSVNAAGVQITHHDGRISTSDRDAVEVANDIHRAAAYVAVRGAMHRRRFWSARRDLRTARVLWFALGFYAAAIVRSLLT